MLLPIAATQEKQLGDWTAVYGSVTTRLGLEPMGVYFVPYFDAIRRCLRQVDTVSCVQRVQGSGVAATRYQKEGF